MSSSSSSSITCKKRVKYNNLLIVGFIVVLLVLQFVSFDNNGRIIWKLLPSASSSSSSPQQEVTISNNNGHININSDNNNTNTTINGAVGVNSGISSSRNSSYFHNNNKNDVDDVAFCNVTLSLGPNILTSYPSHYQLSDFLKGKGLETIESRLNKNAQDQDNKKDQKDQNQSQDIDDDDSIVSCKYFWKGSDTPNHFPHTMQFVLRCWSWWYYNYESHKHTEQQQRTQKQKNFVLLLPSTGVGSLPYLTKEAHYPKYNVGLFDCLQKYANVTYQATTETSNSLLQVRPYLTPEVSFQGYSPHYIHAFRDLIINGLTQEQERQRLRSDENDNENEIMNSLVTTVSADKTVAVAAPPSAAVTTTIKTSTEGIPQRRWYPRIAILNRRGTRKILNDEMIAYEVHSRLLQKHARHQQMATTQVPQAPPPIQIVYFDDDQWTFERQVTYLYYNVDVIVAPHGAQLTSIPFLSNCSSVLEIFPLGYEQHFFFGTLCAISNIEHSYTYLTNATTASVAAAGLFDNRQAEVEDGMKKLVKRQRRRRAQLCLPLDDIVEMILSVIERWQNRCH